MTNRIFSGGALVGIGQLTAGELEVIPYERTPVAGGQVETSQPFIYTIVNGAISGPIVSGSIRIPSPLVARFIVRNTATAATRRKAILDFTGEVEESNDAVTLGEIYEAAGPVGGLSVDRPVVRKGDPVTDLDLTGLPGGGGSGDVSGPGASVDQALAVWDGTAGDQIADSGVTIAGLSATLLAAVDILVNAVTTAWTAAVGIIRMVLGLDAGVFDLDAMPSQYAGDGTVYDRLQWLLDRILLTNAGGATRRSIKILVSPQKYTIGDETAAPFKEGGTLGTYGYGATRYGANTQLLIPATGALATNKQLRILIEAKIPGTADYSVVNGDNRNVLSECAVIESLAQGTGDQSIIAGSRAQDGYAGFYGTNVTLELRGVVVRTNPTSGITAIDASHLFSLQADKIFVDTGCTSDELHNHDPRRNTDGTAYTGGTEIEERKRSVGVRMPRIANGGQCVVGMIAAQGFRHSVEYGEHADVGNIFQNYCYAGVKLRSQSHTSIIRKVVSQRCPIWISGPSTGDLFGGMSKIQILQLSGECYHPNEFGNPATACWFAHDHRIDDPDDLILGKFGLYEMAEELPADGWVTLPSGHGGNLIIERLGASIIDNDTTYDFSGASVRTNLASGVAQIDLSTNKPRWDTWTPLTTNGVVALTTGLTPGMAGTAHVIGKKSGGGTFTLGFTEPTDPPWVTLWRNATPGAETGWSDTPPTFDPVAHDDTRAFDWFSTGLDNLCHLYIEYTDLGVIAGETDEPGALGSPLEDERGSGSYAYNGVEASHPDTVDTLNKTFGNIYPAQISSRNGNGYVINDGGSLVGGKGLDSADALRPVAMTMTHRVGGTGVIECNHNGSNLWNTAVFWQLRVNKNAGTAEIWEYATGGTENQRGTAFNNGSAFTTGDTDIWDLRPQGDTIEAYRNNALATSFTVTNRNGKANTYAGFAVTPDLEILTAWRIHPVP